MARIAVFPGSFDPITNGHIDLVRRFAKVFDKIIVAVGVNTSKKFVFSLEQRVHWLEQVFADDDNIDRVSTDCRPNPLTLLLSKASFDRWVLGQL